MPSSVVRYFRYDAGARRLRVHFVSGDIYDYIEVPLQVYESMKKSGSKGTFLNTRIKGKYAFEKVGPEN
ncbi:MAG TPA: KTSC domain-containing protein [Puia sp.]|uniref:KTSC domain-containing protein n=1 Tax=Puia sp. TaxID=2045100 RepID=UPI002BD54D99|nr:KTSC domain-containing protein [Puia sp.]HVU98365.1 KTSC domain-containing protein [Puia sp.]